MRAVHATDRAYGAPRVTAELNDGAPPEERVNHKRVARVMAERRLAGIRLRRWVRTTIPDAAPQPVPDLLRRDFTADAPNRIYVGDITYLPCAGGRAVVAGGGSSSAVLPAAVVISGSVAAPNQQSRPMFHQVRMGHSDGASQRLPIGWGSAPSEPSGNRRRRSRLMHSLPTDLLLLLAAKTAARHPLPLSIGADVAAVTALVLDVNPPVRLVASSAEP